MLYALYIIVNNLKCQSIFRPPPPIDGAVHPSPVGPDGSAWGSLPESAASGFQVEASARFFERFGFFVFLPRGISKKKKKRRAEPMIRLSPGMKIAARSLEERAAGGLRDRRWERMGSPVETLRRQGQDRGRLFGSLRGESGGAGPRG